MKLQNPILNFEWTDAWTSLSNVPLQLFQRGNNKLSRLLFDQINYLSYPLLQDHIVTIFSLSNSVNPDQAALTADLCLS